VHLSDERLRERGIFRSAEEMVAEAREMVALSVAEIPLRSAGDEPGREFTQGEVEALARGGLDLLRSSGKGVARAAARYAALRAVALTEREAAALLGVTESRVRQRVGEGTLYAVRAGRERRLPRFQFADEGLVPNVGAVLREVPEDAHPLAVERWFATPDPDLILGDDEVPLSPRDWLLSGGSAEVLKPLAREL
jgi:excisionase family DNA binding protein